MESIVGNSTEEHDQPLEFDDILAIASVSQTCFYFLIYLSMVIYVKRSIRPEKMDR